MTVEQERGSEDEGAIEKNMSAQIMALHYIYVQDCRFQVHYNGSGINETIGFNMKTEFQSEINSVNAGL